MSAFYPERRNFKDLLFIIPLSIFYLLYDLGRGSLASWDEALYASVAKDIYLSGDWLRLTLCGDAWFDKPPLCLWATASFYHLFGVSEFSARLFSALCGLGTVWVTYAIGRELLNRWTGFWGALVLVSSLHFFRFARFGMMDAPLTFFLSLALYFFWKGQTKSRYHLLSGAALGLAVLAKGPAAMFFFPIVFLYAWSTRRLEVFNDRMFWRGMLIMAMVSLPWFAYQSLVFGDNFLRAAVFKHLWNRTTTALDGHSGNYYFYIRTLVNKYHPWILVGIVSGPYFLFKAIKDRQEEIIFLTTWMFFVLGAMTLVSTKLAWYIYPLYVPLSLSVGYCMAKLFQEKHAFYVRIFFLILTVIVVRESRIFQQDYSPAFKGIAPLVQKEVPPDGWLHLYEAHESPVACFYFQRRSVYLDSPQDWREAIQRKDVYILIRDSALKAFRSDLKTAGLKIAGSYSDLHLIVKPKS